MRAEVRHQLKQDRFAVATAETVSWAVEHRKLLTTVGIIAGVVVAVVLAGYYYLQQQNQAASLAMAAAFRTYDAPIVPAGTPPQPGMPVMFNSAAERAKAAQPLFQKVAQNYSRTRNGEIARYFLALTDLDVGNSAAAEKQLQDLSSGHNQDLASLAKFALANQYRNNGRDAQAIELYKQLAAHPTTSVSKAQAQLGLAEAYSAKQPDEARKVYQQIQKDNPTSPAAEMAATRLSALK
ncbi:MAG TPA: tetratricopeptide repeat protein [Terriglobales bacterium]|nr:tetratricopeptide repeat protein [Terriglobales bacterium]